MPEQNVWWEWDALHSSSVEVQENGDLLDQKLHVESTSIHIYGPVKISYKNIAPPLPPLLPIKICIFKILCKILISVWSPEYERRKTVIILKMNQFSTTLYLDMCWKWISNLAVEKMFVKNSNIESNTLKFDTPSIYITVLAWFLGGILMPRLWYHV